MKTRWTLLILQKSNSHIPAGSEADVKAKKDACIYVETENN